MFARVVWLLGFCLWLVLERGWALSQGERRASDSSREQVTEWLATARSGVYMVIGETDSVIRFGFGVGWLDAREGTVRRAGHSSVEQVESRRLETGDAHFLVCCLQFLFFLWLLFFQGLVLFCVYFVPYV